jgi:hypothetical protein
MVCQACGAPVVEQVHFCPKCGVQMVAAQPTYAAYPPPPMRIRAPRVQRNLQILGILWCVFGAYRVIGGLVGIFILRVVTLRNFGGGWPFGDQLNGSFGPAPSWLAALFPLIAVYTAITAALALLVGYSLLTRQRWGRTLAIVVGILTLLKPLLGTALGIYTLWVMAPSASGDEYDAITDRS